jgi:hypothetical protein
MPYRAPELFDVKTGSTLDEKVDIWVCILSKPLHTATSQHLCYVVTRLYSIRFSVFPFSI